jgi:hypothetical protein
MNEVQCRKEACAYTHMHTKTSAACTHVRAHVNTNITHKCSHMYTTPVLMSVHTNTCILTKATYKCMSTLKMYVYRKHTYTYMHKHTTSKYVNIHTPHGYTYMCTNLPWKTHRHTCTHTDMHAQDNPWGLNTVLVTSCSGDPQPSPSYFTGSLLGLI